MTIPARSTMTDKTRRVCPNCDEIVTPANYSAILWDCNCGETFNKESAEVAPAVGYA